jgi:mannosyltransferase OCH1-like enzyme
MNNNFRKLMINNINSNPIWKKLEDNFNKYYVENKDEVNIPRKIHQVWLGSEYPDKYKRLRDTWLDKNPDWEYRLWTDMDVENFGLENIDKFHSINNLGCKSDIFRYEILYKYGGLYIDTDFECLKSFNDLTYLDFFSGTGHVEEPETFNGLIACRPQHPLIRKLIDDLKVVQTNNFDQIMSLTGPKYFSQKVFEYFQKNPEDKLIVFPTAFFYAFPAVYRHLVRNDNPYSRGLINQYISPNKSYCVHLWYTSWQK